MISKNSVFDGARHFSCSISKTESASDVYYWDDDSLRTRQVGFWEVGSMTNKHQVQQNA